MAKPLKKTIKTSKLPQAKHGKFLDLQEQLAIRAFETAHKKLVREVEELLRDATMEKSLKSEFELLAKTDRLMRRWTRKVPKIDLAVTAKVEKIVNKYILALKHMLIGDMAGREARKASEEVFGKMMPGIVIGTYLHSIDMERKFYELLYGEDAPKIPMTMILKSFEIIHRQSERMIDQSLGDYRNRILDTVDRAIVQNRFDNIFAIGEKAHELKEDHGKRGSVEKAADEATEDLEHKDAIAQLEETTDKAKEGYERVIRTCLGTVTSAGAHQAMVELYCAMSDRVQVAIVNIRDGRCCKECDRFARNADGSLRLYPLYMLAPAGANNYKKRSEWILTVPPIHMNCRCFLVHIPEGYMIDEYGLTYKGDKK